METKVKTEKRKVTKTVEVDEEVVILEMSQDQAKSLLRVLEKATTCWDVYKVLFRLFESRQF